jgi:hypothetical protein
MPTMKDRLHSPELSATLAEALAAVQYTATPAGLAAVAIACVEPALQAAAPIRKFTPAHLCLVYLLAEQQGATHVRLRRLWDAKAARAGAAAWRWISESGIRTRCSELVAWGIVENTGARGESATGRPAAIWTLVGIDPRAVGRDVAPVPGVDPGCSDALDALLAEAGSDVLIRSQLELAASIAGIRRAAARDDA